MYSWQKRQLVTKQTNIKRKRQSMDKEIQSIGIWSMDLLWKPVETDY